MTEQTERRVVAQPARQVIQQVGERIELTEAELALIAGGDGLSGDVIINPK
jgi:hypothetical protein